MNLEKLNKKRKNAGMGENLSGLMMGSIPVIGFILFGIIPLILAIAMAFMYVPGKGILEGSEFVGLQNFKSVLGDHMFWQSIVNTLRMAIAMPICIVISLIIAFLLTKNIKGRNFFRGVYFVPYVCCAVAVALMWELIFNQNHGILNSWLGLTRENAIPWLTDSSTYTLCLNIIGIWGGTAYGIVLYGAALTNVNRSLYEAAEVDGANAFESFFKITLPSVSPTSFYLLTTGLIGALQEFTRPQIISGNGAGPNNDGLTIVFYIYRRAFVYNNQMGEAAAAAFILSIMILIITVINFVVSKRWVSYD
ncbi:MAG: sugar ABC transporter permease [Ruminococcaceae bacterium]|nr:sugar ABC transporter permease [Oscillospiraceae bacterium]